MVYFQLSKINTSYMLTFLRQNRKSSFFVIWSIMCISNKILIVSLLQHAAGQVLVRHRPFSCLEKNVKRCLELSSTIGKVYVGCQRSIFTPFLTGNGIRIHQLQARCKVITETFLSALRIFVSTKFQVIKAKIDLSTMLSLVRTKKSRSRVQAQEKNKKPKKWQHKIF